MEAPRTPAQPLTSGRPLTSSDVGATLLHGEPHVSVAPGLCVSVPTAVACRDRRQSGSLACAIGTRRKTSARIRTAAAETRPLARPAAPPSRTKRESSSRAPSIRAMRVSSQHRPDPRAGHEAGVRRISRKAASVLTTRAGATDGKPVYPVVDGPAASSRLGASLPQGQSQAETMTSLTGPALQASMTVDLRPTRLRLGVDLPRDNRIRCERFSRDLSGRVRQRNS